MKKSELNEIFEALIGLMSKEAKTIVMDNQGSTRGQLYQIRSATHEQAAVNLGDRLLFVGTAKETGIYLQGMRDLFKEIQSK